MIECLYCGSYREFSTNPDFHFKESHRQISGNVDAQSWKSPHQLHAAMYALGDKYDLAVIKDMAMFNYCRAISGSGMNDVLKFIESIPIVYSSTPDSDRELRDATVQMTVKYPERFLQSQVKASFQKILIEVPEFSWDLHEYWMRQNARWD